MLNMLIILLGKTITAFSRTLNLGHGSTWPGHIALNINKNFIKDILKKNQQNVIASASEAISSDRTATSSDEHRTPSNEEKQSLKTILIAGTNGKTTTGKLVQTILEKNGYKVFQNESGANLLNGIASSMLLHSSILSTINYDYAIFEVDENSLPLVLNEIIPDYLIMLNLFRDQLDRYGEVNAISLKWQKVIQKLSTKTTLILNADDPQIAHLGFSFSRGVKGFPPQGWNRSYTLGSHTRDDKPRVLYFGINNKSLAQKDVSLHADSIYCPNCSAKLTFNPVYFSHLGIWNCTKCKEKRPTPDISNFSYFPIPGVYNIYNTLAAVLLSKTIGITQPQIITALKSFSPAFGRQETIDVDGKKFRLFLSKNPTSFTESLRTIKDLNAKELLIVLNDRIPDGLDVSWIWDINFEEYLTSTMSVHVSGDRCWDMAVRLKYAHPTINHVDTHERLDLFLNDLMNRLPKDDTLYILPTYSAMLEVRKILTGKKIL